MNTNHNHLRLYRKRTPLSQADIAFLISYPDCSNISRYESGQRPASIEFLLLYHLLFNTSIELFFEGQSGTLRLELIERIKELISKIGVEPEGHKNSFRVKFLEQAFSRLKMNSND